MESKTPDPLEIPTALPGFEAEDAREKLLLDASPEDADSEDADDEIDSGKPATKPRTRRRWQVLRIFGGFGIFLGLLAFAVSWFFGMGWFAKPQTQAVNRSAAKDTQTPPMTEDEKFKMAASLVAAKDSETSDKPASLPPDNQDGVIPDGLSPSIAPGGMSGDDANRDQSQTESANPAYSLRQPDQKAEKKDTYSEKTAPSALPDKTRNDSDFRRNGPDNARGRSLFFGIERKPIQTETYRKGDDAPTENKALPIATPAAQIPFGTLLPVRLVGFIYTLRASGGFVRMELTRPIEGKGYSYPAGTTVVGNVRGGESVRAFVTVIGLIDPVSGEFVKFGGELLGRDGSSGIEGRRRKLTSQWKSFFNGLRETASSVLGSVGAIRSGSTVVLSEPIRRGSESMSEDLSNALLGNGKNSDTFIEVSAGASGYVLATDLPNSQRTEAGK